MTCFCFEKFGEMRLKISVLAFPGSEILSGHKANDFSKVFLNFLGNKICLIKRKLKNSIKEQQSYETINRTLSLSNKIES